MEFDRDLFKVGKAGDSNRDLRRDRPFKVPKVSHDSSLATVPRLAELPSPFLPCTPELVVKKMQLFAICS